MASTKRQQEKPNSYRALAPTLAENGYVPIPIKPGSKIPEGRIRAVTGAKWTDTSVDHVPALVEKFGDSYVGVKADGLAAIDIDVYHEKAVDALMKQIDEWGLNLLVRRGRKPKVMVIGRAEHEDQRKRVSAKFEHGGHDHQIEVLGCGQQLVAYAIHPDTKQPYLWDHNHLANMRFDELGVITDELVEKLCAWFENAAELRGWTRKGDRSDSGRKVDGGSPVVVPHYDIERTRGLLQALVDHKLLNLDDYHQWVDVGMVLHMQGQGSFEWLELWQEFSYPDAYDVCEDKWASFDSRQGGTNLEHLQRLVCEAYDKVPADVWFTYHPCDALHTFEVLGDEALPDALDPDTPELADDEEPTDKAECGIEFFTPATLKDRKADRYIVEGLLTVKSRSTMVAAPHTGKSALALELARCVAMGERFGGRVTLQGPVLYWAAEAPKSIARRMDALLFNGILSEDAPLFVPKYFDVNLMSRPKDVIEAFHTMFKAVKAACGRYPVLVIIDTLSDAAPGNDESTGPTKVVWGNLGQLVEKSAGAHFMVIHHTGKDETKGARGSIVGRASVDAEILLKRSEAGSVEVHNQKTRDDAGAGTMFGVFWLAEGRTGKVITRADGSFLEETGVMAKWAVAEDPSMSAGADGLNQGAEILWELIKDRVTGHETDGMGEYPGALFGSLRDDWAGRMWPEQGEERVPKADSIRRTYNRAKAELEKAKFAKWVSPPRQHGTVRTMVITEEGRKRI